MRKLFLENAYVGKPSAGRIVFVILNTLAVLILSFLFLAPYLNILAKSLNTGKDTMLGGLTFWPREFTWDNFNVVLLDKTTYSGLIVSALRVLIGASFALVIQFAAAYVLLQRGLPGKKFLVMLFTIPMFVSGGLVSQYIWYAKLGVYNTFFVYILPGAFSFYNLVVMRTYMNGIPDSLLESARLDGATELKILFRIMMPLCKPIIATVFLWLAVAHWNNWTDTLYFVTNRRLYTLQYNLQMGAKKAATLQEMIQNAIQSGRPLGDVDLSTTTESIQAAQIIVATLPIVCLYPFVQKYFISGVMLGSVKE